MTVSLKTSDIKKTRIDLGLTAKEAAALVLKTERTWHRYESGELNMPPSVWELFKIKTGVKE